MTIVTIHITDTHRAAVLRLAKQNKQVIDVVDDNGNLVRGRVLALRNVTPTKNLRWIADVEVQR